MGLIPGILRPFFPRVCMPNRKLVPEYAHVSALPSFATSMASDMRIQCLSSLAGIHKHTSELEALRQRSRPSSQAISMPAWIAASHPPHVWKQRLLLLRSGGRLEAAIFLLEQTVCGVPTGYFHADEALGGQLILCEEGREDHLLALGMQLLLDCKRAFLILLDRPAGAPAMIAQHRSLRVRTIDTAVHWQHPLQSTFDATVAPLGHRTRRNLRYALRRVQKNGWKFLPTLDATQLASALATLSANSTHPFPAKVSATRLRLAAETPGSFAMGLLDAQGQWLSCLVGRRVAGATEVFWQSNLRGYGTDSLCTTMRALMMQQEIDRGASLVRYVGGTCSHMQHCCTPTEIRQTTIGRRGLRLLLVRALLKTSLPRRPHPLHNHF
jgi:hypothetical protein